MTARDDPRGIAAAALASLPLVTAPRLRRLLDTYRDPERALAAVRAGRVTRAIGRCDGGDAWRSATSDASVARMSARMAERGTRVWIDGDDDYPIAEPFPDRPPILLGEGARADALDQPRVAIVGTRSATPHGLADARELGAFLARAGVTVISGLAIGIDGAAHEGAVDANGLVVGVVATGLDVEYPRRHRSLYRRVREQGLVVSEHGYGVEPRPERFPYRNRIIAAIAHVVVVVEATATGGARITAGYAADYGRPLFALPGSRRNVAAAGCNALLADGAEPLIDPGDLLIALGRGGTRPGGWNTARARPTDPDEAAVLRALGGEPAGIDRLEEGTNMGAARLGAALGRLERAGTVKRLRGLWWPS